MVVAIGLETTGRFTLVLLVFRIPQSQHSHSLLLLLFLVTNGFVSAGAVRLQRIFQAPGIIGFEAPQKAFHEKLSPAFVATPICSS